MTDYKIIRMNRKTVSLSLNDDLEVIVKAPRNVPKQYIEEFVISHSKWIEEASRKRIRRRAFFTDDADRIKHLTEKGREILSVRLSYFSSLTGFVPSGVGITNAKTRFGSCSGKNRINFSCYLFAYPMDAVDYVILHELCHIKHKDHSPRFYAEIERYMPDWKSRAKMLKEIPDVSDI